MFCDLPQTLQENSRTVPGSFLPHPSMEFFTNLPPFHKPQPELLTVSLNKPYINNQQNIMTNDFTPIHATELHLLLRVEGFNHTLYCDEYDHLLGNG
jgi:hypothetical protein